MGWLISTQALSMTLMQNYLAYQKKLMNLHPNMTRFTRNCDSVKALILIFSTEIQLECNAIMNSQYSRWETIEVNPVPAEMQNDVLEASICKALSLTVVNVAPKDLYACHRMTRLDRVIIKFKCCKQKQSVMYKHKDLGTKA